MPCPTRKPTTGNERSAAVIGRCCAGLPGRALPLVDGGGVRQLTEAGEGRAYFNNLFGDKLIIQALGVDLHVWPQHI